MSDRDVDRLKKISRKRHLEEEKEGRRLRSKSWDGKKSPKQKRKDSKKELRGWEDV